MVVDLGCGASSRSHLVYALSCHNADDPQGSGGDVDCFRSSFVAGHARAGGDGVERDKDQVWCAVV